jgi:hypothetical protein
MRAVWSFWSTPFTAHRASAWGNERNHLLAWILSFECARRHYPRTALVTDDDGARLLVDGLGLEFDSVSLALNQLTGHDPSWWTAGKLVAISEQDEPFVHLDPDVFLWAALPDVVTDAPVFAQNPEPYAAGGTYYRPELIETALETTEGTWLPEEWGWYRAPGALARGECCGVVGGTHTDFLRHYADQGLRLIREPANQPLLAGLPDRQDLTITLEQYLLAACIEFHRDRAESPYLDVAIEYLFGSWDEAVDGPRAAELGFTHLIAYTKRDPEISRRLERRVAEQYPARYERCVRGHPVRNSATPTIRNGGPINAGCPSSPTTVARRTN